MAEPSPVAPALTLLLGLGALLRHNARLRQGDLLSPYTLSILVIISIFGVRPLLMLAEESYWFNGISVRAGFNTASMIGLVGLISVTIGYRLGPRPDIFPDEVVGTSTEIRYSMYRGAFLAAAMTISWAAVMAFRGGGTDFLGVLFQGRSAQTDYYLSGLPNAVYALPPAGAVLISGIRILVERERRLHLGERVVFWATVMAATIPPLALGGRRFLIPTLLAAAIATTARRYQLRPRLRHLGFAPLAFVLLAIVPFVRSAGARSGSKSLLDAMGAFLGSEGIAGTIRRFFTSSDTEMFSYVALVSQRLGEDIPWGLGRGTLGEALVNPFPSSTAPFPLWSDVVLTKLWGEGCNVSGGYCPVPSWFGVTYFDFGLIGVVAGGLLLGYLCQQYPRALAQSENLALLLVLGAACFAPVLVRGNTISAAYITAITVAIAGVMMPLSRKRQSSPLKPGTSFAKARDDAHRLTAHTHHP